MCALSFPRFMSITNRFQNVKNKSTRSYFRYFATVSKLSPFSKEDTTEFMSYFPLVVRDLTEDHQLKDIKHITERFADCLHYTVPTGKRIRGLTTVITYKFLEKRENLTAENIKLANLLGWCTELVEGCIIVFDDIMDNSITRRNNVCWHCKEGSNAIVDGIALNSSCYILLTKYLDWHPFYSQMCNFSHKILLYTVFGQTMDSFRYQSKDISMAKCKIIHKYKTGLYTFYYPTILGMYLSKTFTEHLDKQLAPILYDMGELFQINNDMHDCFADVTVTGKLGSDIQESKCTWLAARALEKCSASQRKYFEESYGKPGKEEIDKIRNLYLELNVLNDYLQHEQDVFSSLLNRANSLENPYGELVIVLINKLQDQMKRYGQNLTDPYTLK